VELKNILEKKQKVDGQETNSGFKGMASRVGVTTNRGLNFAAIDTDALRQNKSNSCSVRGIS